MTYLLRLTDKHPDAVIDAAVAEAIQNATVRFQPLQFEFEYPRTGFGITTLTPKAVAASNQGTGLQGTGVVSSTIWGVSTLAANTWADWININVDDRIYIVVTGVFNRTSTPQISNIRFKANGEDLPWVNLDQMYNWEVSQAYLQRPLIISPTNNFTVRAIAEKAITGASGVPAERIGLLGYILAKRTYLISET